MSCSRVGGCGVSQSVLVGHQFRSHTSSAATELFVSSGHQGTSPVQVTQHRGAQGTSVQQGSTGHVTSSGHQLRSLSVCPPNQAAQGYQQVGGCGVSQPAQVVHQFRSHISGAATECVSNSSGKGIPGVLVAQFRFRRCTGWYQFGEHRARHQFRCSVQVAKGQNESISADHGGSVD